MKTLSIEAKLGLFVVGAVLALFYLTFSIGGKKMFTVGGKRAMIVYFKTITGVTEKSDVRMAGVKIGEVRSITLDHYRAKVLIDLYGDYNIPVDSVATVQGKGLLGEKFVEIKPGSAAIYLVDGATLERSVSAANLDEVVAKLSDALDDVKSVTSALSKSLGGAEGEAGLKSIIKNLSQLSGSFNEVIGANKDKLNAIIDNVDKSTKILEAILRENRENFKGTMANFNTVSRSLAEKAPDLLAHLDAAAAGIKDMVNDNKANLKDSMANIKDASGNFNTVLQENRENFKIAMENLKKSSEKLDDVMANLKQVTAKLEKGEGTMGKLIQDEEVYNGINDTLEGAKGLTKQVGAMKVAVGARGESIINPEHYSQASRSYFSIQVKPREDKYYMIELSNDIRKPIPPGGGSLGNLLYTFYIAKRFGNVTLKGGLMESSGGGGFDIHGWDDKLRLSVEALNLSGYDTNATSPQIRVVGRWYPQKYLYLYLGGDELANKYYRTYYAGIGILADEDDFKFFFARFF